MSARPRRLAAALSDGVSPDVARNDGSAKIAGKGIANPVGAILSAAMLFRYSLKQECEAAALESAFYRAISDGCLTADLGGTLSTQQMADEIIDHLPGGFYLGI